MNATEKPKLNVVQQIELLESRGVTFKHISRDEAIESLSKTNNYFKLTAYRKNFDTDSQGKYLHLDFAYLKDLSKIDMHLRNCLLELSLDVEHFAKSKLMAFITQSSEDGYSIVQEHIEHSIYIPDKTRPDIVANPYKETFSKAQKNEYCSDLYHKHKNNMPIWALIEIIQFGTFVSLYRFIADKHRNNEMLHEHFMMKDISRVRNAAAHNNCIINDLSKDGKKNPDYGMLRALSAFMRKDVYDSKLANSRIFQITTLLYMHKKIVTSGLHGTRAKKLHDLVAILNKNILFYKDNPRLLSVFEYFGKVVDNWF